MNHAQRTIAISACLAVLIAACAGVAARDESITAGQPSTQEVAETPLPSGVVRLQTPPKRIAGASSPDLSANVLRKMRGKQGMLLVRFVIAEDGSVGSATIVKSTLEELDALLIDHVRSWKFEPAVVDGKAVSVVFSQAFRFKF